MGYFSKDVEALASALKCLECRFRSLTFITQWTWSLLDWLRCSCFSCTVQWLESWFCKQGLVRMPITRTEWTTKRTKTWNSIWQLLDCVCQFALYYKVFHLFCSYSSALSKIGSLRLLTGPQFFTYFPILTCFWSFHRLLGANFLIL